MRVRAPQVESVVSPAGGARFTRLWGRGNCGSTAGAGGSPRQAVPQSFLSRPVRTADRQQLLSPMTIDELLEPDHPARAVWSYVQGLDLTPLYDRIRARGHLAGRPAIDPRLLAALWLYATLAGFSSAGSSPICVSVTMPFAGSPGESPSTTTRSPISGPITARSWSIARTVRGGVASARPDRSGPHRSGRHACPRRRRGGLVSPPRDPGATPGGGPSRARDAAAGTGRECRPSRGHTRGRGGGPACGRARACRGGRRALQRSRHGGG